MVNKIAFAGFVEFGGLLAGLMLGVTYPPCCPGDQLECNVVGGELGVQYCRRTGFGWESCQTMVEGQPYPQAFWR